jgi:hypothetical protein
MADLHLGVLAEDGNDCDVIHVLVRRLCEARGMSGRALHVHNRAHGGSGNLRRNAERWFAEVAAAGCSAAILVHDLDRDPVSGQLKDEAGLARELAAKRVPRGLRRLVCIPVEEIEAWFFSTESILRKLGGEKARAHPSPHLIADPKKKLTDLSRGANRRPRYSPNDNPRLAEDLDLAECARRCPAFRALAAFVHTLVA